MGSRVPEQLVASIEEDPIAQSLESRTTFIPLRHNDLVVDLLERFQIRGNDSDQFTATCARLQRIFHAEHLTQLLHLEEIYGPLDPDSQAVELEMLNESEVRQRVEKLFDRVSGLLFSAHYKRLDRNNIERAMDMASQWGVRLEVNFDLYDRIEIFARGYHVVQVKRRRWQNMFREESIELPEFERLIMAFRLKPEYCDVKPEQMSSSDVGSKPNRRKQLTQKISRLLAGDDEDALDANHVYLKTFKNIPETDLEILLPGSKVRFSLVDRGKILLPTAFALYKASRLVVVAIAVVAAFTFDNVLAFVILFGAIVGYFAKSFLSYFRTKEKYQFGLTKNLYLKNLGNNLGVLYRILNEAEEQELLETILGYTILWQQQKKVEEQGRRFIGLTSSEMDEQVESYLSELTHVDIDFEVFDSLGKLARLGLASVDGNGRWSAIPIDQSQQCLDDSWSRLFNVRGMRVEFDSAKDDGLFAG